MKQPAWRQLTVLLVLAFAIRLAAGWAWQSRLDGNFGMGDSDSYWNLSKAIAEGRPYELGEDHAKVFRTPGYPVLLAPIFWLADDGRNAVLLARAEAALLGTLAVWVVWWLAKLLFDARTAMLAAVFATFYPGGVSLSALVLSEAPFCPLMLLQLVFWTIAWNAPSSGRRTAWSFCAGLAAGAATLMRPSWLLFTPFALAVSMLMGKVNYRRLAICGENHPRLAADGTSANDQSSPTFRRPLNECGVISSPVSIAFWMLLGLVVAMCPWWIRNAYVTGRFVPTTLQVGASLYDGLNPEATGGSNMDFVKRFEAEERQATKPSPGGAEESLELRLDQRMRHDALAWACANPGRAVQLAGVKFLRMWNVWPNEPGLASRWIIRWAVFFAYTPLLILAIIGAWRTLGRGWPYILCWLPAVYLTMLHVVFVSSIRYRDPAMLALLALAAGAVCMKRRGTNEYQVPSSEYRVPSTE